ncbi:MAG: hypothetical protein ABFR47_09040 [Verrucomicrobiota bacterium]
MDARGKVPHFTLRPHPVVSMVLILVMIVGLLTALSFFSMEEGTGVYRQKGIFTLILTSILSICLAIVATAKMWFSHLWKKNSTHARHKEHTQYHPAIREREFRERR